MVVFRLLLLMLALGAASPVFAGSVTVNFTAVVGSSNDIDSGNVFGEGAGANLRGQVITGSITIDPPALNEVCNEGSACYGDFGGGAVSVSFSLNGMTSTVVSGGTQGYFGNRSGGSLSISDPAHGLDNYLGVGATGRDGMLQQSIGVLFNAATVFSASADALVAVDSLDSIGSGFGLVKGGITLLSPIEHVDATILSIDVAATDVPEPAGVVCFGVGLVALMGLGPRCLSHSRSTRN